MNKCPFCNDNLNDLSDLEEHLLNYHCINMQSYYEYMLSLTSKVSTEKYPLTLIDNSYYLPNWLNITNYFEKKQAINMVQTSILDYYNKILGDRFLQMFLITNNYYNNTLSHTFDEFKEVLKDLPGKDRNKIWFLDWKPGYPKIISKNNIEGIKLIDIDNRYTIKTIKQSIQINNWIVNYPEIIPFDQRHHSRYNLLNYSIDARNTKRLRLKDDKDTCIKFFNGDNDFKTLFKITDLDNNPIKLSEQDLVVTRLILLRTKIFMKLIIQVVSEIIKNVNTYRDSVFLRNTVEINPDIKNKSMINLAWSSENFKKNYINISIL